MKQPAPTPAPAPAPMAQTWADRYDDRDDEDLAWQVWSQRLNLPKEKKP